MKNKRVTTIFLVIVLALVMVVSASANDSASIDTYLYNLGVPSSVVENMTDMQKAYIVETIEPNSSFKSFIQEGFVLSQEDGTLQPHGSISSSDLTLSVVAFEQTSSIYGTQYRIYPSFVWHTLTNISNDVFGFALYPGWEVVPEEENLRVYVANLDGELVQNTDIDPCTSSYSGYAYKMDGVGIMNLRHEGHASILAHDTTGSSTHAISMKYAHDNANIFTASYSIAIGPASISISPNGGNVDTLAGNYYFD